MKQQKFEQAEKTVDEVLLIFNVFACLAQFERRLIRERTNP